MTRLSETEAMAAEHFIPKDGFEEAPELEAVAANVPFREAVKSWMVPPVKLLGEDRFADFDFKTNSHVVLQ